MQFFLQRVEKMFPHDRDRLRRMSIIEEGHPQFVRMSYLAIVGSHAVNGVAALHSSLLRNVVRGPNAEQHDTDSDKC